ncbi:MAG: hypothetical protein Q8O62_14675 [Aequorivita sp.]|nr:hypothetical protein [Aequorivita sp.]
MHKELLVKAYEKVARELFKKQAIQPSLKACGDELSLIITETFPYSEKSFRNLYNKAKEGEEITIKQPKVVDALAQYLEYKDFRDFENQNSLKKKESKAPLPSPNFISKNQSFKGPNLNSKFFLITIFMSFLLASGFFGYHYFTKQRWMEWQGTHYVEASFEAEKLKNGVLKAYKDERVENFEQLTPNCETIFFNDDGSARIWYVKNKNGSIEYFSSYGLHPKTGKALKPLSQYMINKYLCK